MSIKEISDDTFEAEVLKSEKPVIVDFWAPWCGPCKMMIPVLESASETMGEKFKFVKINISDNPKIAAKYNVTSIPTLMLFESGEMKSSHVGYINQAKLENWSL